MGDGHIKCKVAKFLMQLCGLMIVNGNNICHLLYETQLKSWLDRALKDDRWDFQSMLLNRLDQNDDFDSLQDKKWAQAQTEKYQAVGVTMNDKDFYYQEQLVNIFLDLRSNKSFCTLNMNPKGRINIKIIRNENDEITGVAYMTDAEVAKLLEEPFGDSKKDALE